MSVLDSSDGSLIFQAVEYNQNNPAISDDASIIVNGDYSGYAHVYEFNETLETYEEKWSFNATGSGTSTWIGGMGISGDGTVIHTKRVFTLAYELSRGLDCEYNRDEICGAALLHDFAKQGLDPTGHTVRDHPQIMAALIADVYNTSFKDKLDKNSANIIYWSVFHHYGPFTIKKHRKPIEQFTQEELCIYTADYVASKRFIHIDHIKKEGLSV